MEILIYCFRCGDNNCRALGRSWAAREADCCISPEDPPSPIATTTATPTATTADPGLVTTTTTETTSLAELVEEHGEPCLIEAISFLNNDIHSSQSCQNEEDGDDDGDDDEVEGPSGASVEREKQKGKNKN